MVGLGLNYWAPAAAGGPPHVILNSHVDTVPPWFGSSDDGEFLIGRGACDTKGVIAAMIAAGERLRSEGVRDFAFLFVVGEETDSIGAKSANVAFAALGSKYVIVGEPTESKFARASKGALTCTLHFDGVAAHSAYPERGDSAIARLRSANTRPCLSRNERRSSNARARLSGASSCRNRN